jgi:uncharacterized membrane protein YeaQ/YmgE (transglycosylase-associated protein family)
MGLLVGIVAKVIMPGDGPGGFIMTIILGIIGAFVGGFISKFFGFNGFTGFNFPSFIIATVGAVVVLFGHRMLTRR